jgi:adenine deaminase
MAIARGLDPVRAIQMVSLNTATYFRLKGLGAVLPGYEADILVLDDLEQVRVSQVYHAGRLVAKDGSLVDHSEHREAVPVPPSVNVDWDKVGDLSMPARGDSVRIIGVVPGQIVTREITDKASVIDGKVVSDPTRDILKIAVIERHKGTGSCAVGLIQGFGLKSGALASTVAHDAHNIIVVGADDRDMLRAAHKAAEMGGGLAVVDEGQVLAALPLPIAGLMSDNTVEEVSAGLEQVVEAARKLGCTLEAPFATLSFMALTPIPELKLTDQGLFDSVHFAFTSLFVD